MLERIIVHSQRTILNISFSVFFFCGFFSENESDIHVVSVHAHSHIPKCIPFFVCSCSFTWIPNSKILYYLHINDSVTYSFHHLSVKYYYTFDMHVYTYVCMCLYLCSCRVSISETLINCQTYISWKSCGLVINSS